MMKKLGLLLSALFTAVSQLVIAQCNPGEANITVDVTTDQWGYEVYWEMVPQSGTCGDGSAIFQGGNTVVGCAGSGTASAADAGAYANSTAITETVGCIAYGTALKIVTRDDWGDGGNAFVVNSDGGELTSLAPSTAYDSVSFTIAAPPAYNTTNLYNNYLNLYSSKNYAVIPGMQTGDMWMGVDVRNAGTAASINTTVDVSISGSNGVVFTSTGSVDTIPSGDTLGVYADDSWSTNLMDVYTVDYTVSADSADSNPGDNMSSQTFAISDTIYSRDANDIAFGLNAAAFSSTGPYEFGNYYEFVNPDTVKSISVMIGPSTVVGTPIQAKLYDVSGATELASSGFYTVQASDIGAFPNFVVVTLPLSTPYVVSDTNVFIASMSDQSGTDTALQVISTNVLPDDPSRVPGLMFANGSWGGIAYYPFVRLNTGANPCSTFDVQASAMDVDCYGNANGSIALAASGTAPYTYNWSNGGTTDSIGGLAPGNYAVSVMDANGCSFEGDWDVMEPDTVLYTSSLVSTDEDCGAANGTAEIMVEGGTMPYSYMWADGSTTADVNGMVAGTYGVTATDANGCTVMEMVTVDGAVSTVAITASETTADNCAVGQGEATAMATGQGSVSYLWDNGQMTATATGLTQGVVMLTVTDSVGCTGTSTVTITGTPGVEVMVTTTDASCGSTDGSATAIVTAGTSPYMYLWNNLSTDQTATGLGAGIAGVQVTDANGCTATEGNAVNNPPADISVTTAGYDVSCFAGTDGAVVAMGAGTGTSYTYAWFDDNLTAVGTTDSVGGLMAGEFVVSVVDNNGCATATGIEIFEPTMLEADAMTDMDASCFGSADGQLTASAMGGTAPYMYMWDNDSTTATVAGLGFGNYDVTITDANGCMEMASASVAQPSVLVGTATATDISCNGQVDGEVMVSATGGTSPYTFMWDNGLGAVASANGLAAATYNVTITDDNGCESVKSADVVEPGAIAATVATTNDFVCFGAADGSATATVSGGTAPFSFDWSNSTSTSNNLSGASGGTYDVTVTDVNGCMGTSNTVTITEGTSAVVVGNVDTTGTSCENCTDGMVDVTVSGGSSPYTFAWSNAETTEDLAAVAAGDYTVQITDADGCAVTSGPHTVNAGPNAITEAFGAEGVKVYPNPSNGTFNVSVAGAKADNFTFTVTNLIGQTVSFETVALDGTFVKTITLPSIEAGVYFVTIKNSKSEITERIIIK